MIGDHCTAAKPKVQCGPHSIFGSVKGMIPKLILDCIPLTDPGSKPPESWLATPLNAGSTRTRIGSELLRDSNPRTCPVSRKSEAKLFGFGQNSVPLQHESQNAKSCTVEDCKKGTPRVAARGSPNGATGCTMSSASRAHKRKFKLHVVHV